MSNYPPGVTGNEWQIAGPLFENEVGGECPECGDDECLTWFQLDNSHEEEVSCGTCLSTFDASLFAIHVMNGPNKYIEVEYLFTQP